MLSRTRPFPTSCKTISVLHLSCNNLGPQSALALAGLMQAEPVRLPPDPNEELKGTVARCEEEEESWVGHRARGVWGVGCGVWGVGCRV